MRGSLVLVGLLFAFEMALATGSTSSGGGSIHRDEGNPWFLENTWVVQYCIDLDEENFGVSTEDASRHVSEAIDDWVAAFKVADDAVYLEGELTPFGQVRVATQKFVEVPCPEGGDLDLRFQLGKLTVSMKQEFKNPEDYIGIAIRTDYDRFELKGRGYVYLSPVSGPLKPDHEGIYPNAWSEMDFLAFRAVLRHELGHVFGVSHSNHTIMDETWPEKLVDERYVREVGSDILRFEAHADLQRFIGHNNNWHSEGCGRKNPISIYSVFGLTPQNDDCGYVYLQNRQLKILHRSAQDLFPKVIGSAYFDNSRANVTPMISVHLTKDQQVFKVLPDETRRSGLLQGEYRRLVPRMYGEIHVKETNKNLPVILRAGNHDNVMRGTILKDGIFYEDSFSLDR